MGAKYLLQISQWDALSSAWDIFTCFYRAPTSGDHVNTPHGMKESAASSFSPPESIPIFGISKWLSKIQFSKSNSLFNKASLWDRKQEIGRRALGKLHFLYLENIISSLKTGRIHDCISGVRWAGAVTEVRSPFGEKLNGYRPMDWRTDGPTELLIETRVRY